MHTQHGPKESDRSYIKRIDKLILEGVPIGDEVKLLEVVFGLQKGAKMWWRMIADYLVSYTEFRRRASDLIHTIELLES